MKQSYRPLVVAAVCLVISFALPVFIAHTGPNIKPTVDETTAFYGAGSITDNVSSADRISRQTVPAIQSAFNATIAVITPEGHLIGSGVIIRHKKGEVLKILTAWHVARVSYPKLQAVGLLYSGEIIPVQVQKYNEAWDLAILTSIIVEDEDGPAVSLATEEPKLGEDVWIIGHPRGMLGNVTKGVLSNTLHADKDLRYYRVDAAAFFGNSGGGLFNSQGELIGIADALEYQQLKDGQSTIVPGGSLCVSLYNLKLFVGA